MSGGLTAAGLLALLLAFIGLGVGIYYAYICLRARPLRSKPPTDPEQGPLISPDPDFNGNVEDAPLEASAPVEDDVDTKDKASLDEPDSSNDKVKPPVSDLSDDANKSSGTPKPNDNVLVPVEDETPPAKLMHKRENVPSMNHVAPLGFVTPVLHEPSPDQCPQNIRPIPQPLPEIKVSPAKNAPTPVYIPVPPTSTKKPLALSDEEDGLLLQECFPDDDSLDQECTPKPTSFVPDEKLENSPQNEEPEVSALPLKEDQIQNAPACVPPNVAATTLLSETVHPKSQLENPSSTANLKSIQPVPAPQSAEPKICIAPQPPFNYGWKEDVAHVGKAEEPVTSELSVNQISPLLMKEDIEQLHPIQDAHDLVPINKDKLDKPEEISSGNNNSKHELCSLSPDSSAKELPLQPKVIPIISLQPLDDNENTPKTKSAHGPKMNETVPGDKTDCSPPVYLEPSQPEEILRNPSESSVSSEEAVPPYTEASESNVPESGTTEESPEAVIESSVDDRKRQPLVDSCKPLFVVNVPLESPFENSTEASTVLDKPALKEPSQSKTEAPLHASGIPDEILADIPLKASADTSMASANVPSKASTHVPLEASDIPLEAYISNTDEQYDSTEEDGNSLGIIKEEGSVDTDSETTETDSSEPEVTEYTLSSGRFAPSTSAVLADEVSCALEPEVTKYSRISDVEAFCDSDLDDSEHSDSDDYLSKSVGNNDNNKESKQTNLDSSQDKPDSSSHCAPSLKDTLPSTVDLEDLHSDVLASVTSSNDGYSRSPDPINILSRHKSNSESSDTESEGVEAEAGCLEEIVKMPTAVHKEPPLIPANASPGVPTHPQTCSSPPVPSQPQTSLDNNTEAPVEVSDPHLKNLLNVKVPNKVPQELPDSAEEDMLSSSSSASDLSDDNITTSTPKKSKIPRLFNHNES
ncbi:hypothetical protein OTU49_007350 [Cherax quadricarinatus]|uniref:Uncharacterized protein n=1 Tax=Cherax quadricarinatus TaxID=27406 RepID=A0AAW0WXI2_CHEQU|nr:treacle protein-like [Cherax quadricarinatus]